MVSRDKAKAAFDLALKQSKGGKQTDMYCFDDGRKYLAYYSNEQWSSFKKEMQDKYPKAYQQFINGDGGELEEKKSESGLMMPPKMASYASSSRFVFEESKLLKDAFTFEYKLPIAFRGFGGEAKASLDGFIPSRRIFVEAKCHEFYSSLSTEYKRAYKNFYDYLHHKTNGFFSYRVTPGKNKDYVHFKWNDKEIQSLDLKQLLCHMLGIAKKSLLEDCSDISTLIYLVYRPEDGMLRLIPDEETRFSILCYWEQEKKEFEMIDFSLLYRHIVHYIFDHKKSWQKEGRYSTRVVEIAESFAPEFCDQQMYRSIIDSIIAT